MTRAAVLTRVRDELDAAWPGDQADGEASVDDVDALIAAVRDALDECRDQIEDLLEPGSPV